MKNKKITNIIIVILIICFASVLVYVNQTPLFLEKTIRIFNKNYEYTPPSADLESAESIFADALYNSKAIVATKEGVKVYSHSLKPEFNASFSGENPIIKHCDDKFIVFHKNSNKALFVNGKKTIPITASGNILTASVNENGYFALLTEEKGFKSQIIVYDKNGEEFYKWHSAENFVNDIALSSSNITLAAVAIDYSDSLLKSKLLIFDTATEEPKEVTTEECVTAIEFLSKSKIAAVCGSSIAVYDNSGKRCWNHSFGNKEIFAFTSKDGKIAAAAGELNLGTENVDVLMFNESGKAIVNYKNKGEVNGLDILENNVLVVGKRYLRVASSKEKAYLKTAKDISSAHFFGNEKTVLVHSGSNLNIEYFD